MEKDKKKPNPMAVGIAMGISIGAGLGVPLHNVANNLTQVTMTHKVHNEFYSLTL